MNKEEVNLAWPPTVDELQAEDENQLLNAKKLPPVSVTDDHLTHIDIHSKANQNAWSLAHIQAHKKLMLVKRDRTDLFPPKQVLEIKPRQGKAKASPAPELATA